MENYYIGTNDKKYFYRMIRNKKIICVSFIHLQAMAYACMHITIAKSKLRELNSLIYEIECVDTSGDKLLYISKLLIYKLIWDNKENKFTLINICYDCDLSRYY